MTDREARDRPNIVFLFPDQLRADFLSSYGNQGVRTTHMDSVGDPGIRYDGAVSGSPVCVPARTALLTGMNALRNGVTDNGHRLRPDHREAGTPTWPEILSEHGYYTAAVGKMHFYPWDEHHGFQYRRIAEDKRWPYVRDDHYHALADAGDRKRHAAEFPGYYENKGAVTNATPRERTADGFVGDEALRFLQTHGGEQPFALMVGFPGPHGPYDPHPESLDEVDAAALPPPVPASGDDPASVREQAVASNALPWNHIDYSDFPDWAKHKIREHYAALVSQVDTEVGRILAQLEESGLAANTAVILASDHGDYLGDHDLIGKHSFFEGAVRVPLLVREPGADAAHARGDLVELRDITATILSLAGVDVPAHCDSRPLPGLGLGTDEGRDIVFGMLHDAWMAFDGRYKLHKYEAGEMRLYDLDADPEEQHDLSRSSDHAEVRERLDAALTAEVMRSVSDAMADRYVGAATTLWNDAEFGKEGFHLPFPKPADEAAEG